MRKNRTGLFDPLGPTERRHPFFEEVRTSPNGEPGRTIAREVFSDFHDVDGNFVEQFQTTGFDSRVFELYLFAYFSRSGFAVERSFGRPDFIVENDLGRVAVEATTSNRTRSFDVDEIFQDIAGLTPEVVVERVRGLLPIRLGGPLRDKLKMRYWELPHVAGLPLVLAIEPFHDTTSLLFSSSALSDYLYGIRHAASRDSDGNLIITATPIEEHVLGSKTIPSGLFYQADAENISAVVFSNSGTWGKFTRMGFQAGHHRGNLRLFREGTCHDADPRASEPLTFSYLLNDTDYVESWGEGLEVFHNPRATVPLPRGYFPSAADHVLRNGIIDSLVPEFHPYRSTMMNAAIRGFELSRDRRGVTVESIMKSEFDALFDRAVPLPPMWKEREWLADRRRTVLGTLVEDLVDHEWAFALVRRGEGLVNMESGFADPDSARNRAVDALVYEVGKA